MDNLTAARRLSLCNGLMAYGLGLLSVRLIERLKGTPNLAADLEKMGEEIVREIKNGVPEGYTIDDEADAIGQVVREFQKNIGNFVALARSGGS